MSDKQTDLFGFKPVGDLLSKVEERARPKPPSRVQRRAIETSTAIASEPSEQIGYQHTVLCQTSMPYRDPGQDVRVWDREQGAISLRINAGDAKNPDTGEWVEARLAIRPQAQVDIGAPECRGTQDGFACD